MKTRSKFLIVSLVLAALLLAGMGVSAFSHKTQASPSESQQWNLQPEIDIELVGQIGGSIEAIDIQGHYAYVGQGPRLAVVDVFDPAHPVVVGQTDILPGFVDQVEVEGNYAYVSRASVLSIIDVTDPAAPYEVGFYDKVDTIYSMAVAENYVYISYQNSSADYETGLRVLDVSDPAHPFEAGDYTTTDMIQSVVVVEDYAYIAYSHGGLLILDVSNPSEPEFVSQTDDSQKIAVGVTVQGDYAFVVGTHWEGDGHLRIFDITKPASPDEIGYCSLPEGVEHVEVSGNYAYVNSLRGSMEIFIIDVTDPTEPTNIGTFDTPGLTMDLQLAGEYAYIADGHAGLSILTIEDPTNLAVVGSHQPISNVSLDVIAADGYAYVTDYHVSLSIFDLADPTQPTLIGTYDTPEYPTDLALDGDNAYVTDYDAGLRIIDVSDPVHLSEVGFYEMPRFSNSVDVAGDHAYVVQYSGWESDQSSRKPPSLHIINITDPVHPNEIAHYDTTEEPWASCVVETTGDYAYLFCHDALHIIDITNPIHPQQVGTYEEESWTHGIAVAGRYVYLANHLGIRTLDVSNPANPVTIGWYDLEWVYDIEVAGKYAIVSSRSKGVTLFDISDPTQLREVSSYDTPVLAVDSAKWEDYLYVADNTGGFVILHISGLSPTSTPTPTPTPSATPTFTPTPTATATPTPTPTPTSTPSNPWAVWRGDGEVLIPPLGVELAIDYGNLTAPSPLTAELDGFAQFDNGLNTMTDTLPSAGSYALSLHPAPDALPEQPITLRVTLPDIVLHRNGVIAHPIYMPVMMKPS